MSSQPALRLVNADTGEVVSDCPDCEDRAHLVKELERKIVGLSRELAKLQRDSDAEAREHPLYDEGRRWHDVWREACRHPRVQYGPEEFWQALWALKGKATAPLVGQAIAGAAFDPFVTPRRNGSKRRHDGWELIFRDKDHFREFVAKAPKEATA